MLRCVAVCYQVLLDAGIKTADAVVLGSGPPVGAELEADARILAAVLQVSHTCNSQCSAIWHKAGGARVNCLLIC